MNATMLEHLERGYQANWQKRETLRFRLADYRVKADRWARDGNEDAETLRQLDELGLRQARQIAAAYGVDVIGIVDELEARLCDDQPQF